jgi:DNA-binding CsgD family transcriptional regulator
MRKAEYVLGSLVHFQWKAGEARRARWLNDREKVAERLAVEERARLEKIRAIHHEERKARRLARKEQKERLESQRLVRFESNLSPFTEREELVRLCRAVGMTQKQIADRLGVTASSVSAMLIRADEKAAEHLRSRERLDGWRSMLDGICQGEHQ